MKKLIYLTHIFLLLLCIIGCSSSELKNKEQENKHERTEITVSAAASLTDVLNDIKSSFEKEYPTIHITFNFGSSGTLQQQILQGAPIDIFFSAAEDMFDTLQEKGLIDNANMIDLVGNQIVLVTPKNSEKEIISFNDLKDNVRIAIGSPETVPAGKYAKETLGKIGVWSDVENNIVYAKDVRQVLTYVETGNVDAGIVYQSDALKSSKVNVQVKAAEDTHTPIIYPLGIIKESKNPKEALIFYNYMQSEKALTILEENGFENLLK
ncbi:molybdate ABC transporter substrate-binding protein [Metabacillus sediminilitoris]|uniref:Molybdate ABC transporter substrate-binding protein n=1 Tax=Metabacillus sediminilitoris TaxID=2567941 RepID=A0A4S4BW10_9BACI|nr:molybdate ABC transporter substrate-binding protein [Metabacillus sediminilitoris]QGQ46177.1 molybdate ABC transporter substrate-binding protein [Metabacillus sediminilitoris]THF79230.1 molybdate ABC transporter substrate-binding protein [Metabacillus sediminilitoris]